MFMRAVTPVLNTGTRSAHGYWSDVVGPRDAFRQVAGTAGFAVVQRKLGAWPLAYARPASKNGAISVGRNGKFTRPNSGTPKSGMRNSALATITLLPNRRSTSAQPVVAAGGPPDCTHSSAVIE